MKFEFSAGGIVFTKVNHQIYFALILDSYNKWTFPKGKIENKEKPESAALRETSEELGIKNNLKIIKPIEKVDYWFKLEGQLIHKFVYYYLLKAPSLADLSYQQEEINDAQWVTQKEALKLLGYRKNDLPLIKKAITMINDTG